MTPRKKPANTRKRKTESSRRGRTTSKMTDEIRAAILTSLEAGAPMWMAAEAAGVSANTVNEWVRRGTGEDDRTPSSRYVSFAQEVAKMQAAAGLKAVAVVRGAMDKSWQAAAWFLERRFPDEFALKTRTELTGKNGQPLIPSDADFSKMSDEELQAIAAGSATGTTRKG